MGFRILGRSWPRNFRIGTGFERQFSNPAKPDGATTESNFWPPVFDFSYAIPLPLWAGLSHMGFRTLGRSWPRNFRIGTGFERQFSNPAKPDGATTESNFWPPVFDFSYAIPLPHWGRGLLCAHQPANVRKAKLLFRKQCRQNVLALFVGDTVDL